MFFGDLEFCFIFVFWCVMCLCVVLKHVLVYMTSCMQRPEKEPNLLLVRLADWSENFCHLPVHFQCSSYRHVQP